MELQGFAYVVHVVVGRNVPVSNAKAQVMNGPLETFQHILFRVMQCLVTNDG